jgi:hypothetical protein
MTRFSTQTCPTLLLAQLWTPTALFVLLTLTILQLHNLFNAGMPHLTAGLTWDPKRSLLLLALRQSGSKAVMRGALKAAELPPGIQAAAAAAAAAAAQQQGLGVSGGPEGLVAAGVQGGAPTVQLKVLVRELDVLEEHPIQVGVCYNMFYKHVPATCANSFCLFHCGLEMAFPGMCGPLAAKNHVALVIMSSCPTPPTRCMLTGWCHFLAVAASVERDIVCYTEHTNLNNAIAAG